MRAFALLLLALAPGAAGAMTVAIPAATGPDDYPDTPRRGVLSVTINQASGNQASGNQASGAVGAGFGWR